MNHLEQKISREVLDTLKGAMHIAPAILYVDDDADATACLDDETAGMVYRDETDISAGLIILNKYKPTTCAPESLPFPDALNAYGYVIALHAYLPIIEAAAETNPDEFGRLAELTRSLVDLIGSFGEMWEPNF